MIINLFISSEMGENLADDITYSGTACAALEGALRNIKSIAISKILAKSKEKDDWSGICLLYTSPSPRD